MNAGIALLGALAAFHAPHHHKPPVVPPATPARIGATVTVYPSAPSDTATDTCPPREHIIELSYGVGNDMTLDSASWDAQMTALTVTVHLDSGDWPYGTFYYWIRCR